MVKYGFGVTNVTRNQNTVTRPDTLPHPHRTTFRIDLTKTRRANNASLEDVCLRLMTSDST